MKIFAPMLSLAEKTILPALLDRRVEVDGAVVAGEVKQETVNARSVIQKRNVDFIFVFQADREPKCMPRQNA